MLVVIALGGNALLRRGEPLTAENQRTNVRRAAAAIVKVIEAGHQVVICHGNGPQVGLLALQSAAHKPEEAYPSSAGQTAASSASRQSSTRIARRACSRRIWAHRPC